jgi:hypothetical protein
MNERFSFEEEIEQIFADENDEKIPSFDVNFDLEGKYLEEIEMPTAKSTKNNRFAV